MARLTDTPNLAEDTPRPEDAPQPEDAPEPENRRHDETYKKLFLVAVVVLVLIREFIAKGWVHELDLTRLERFPTESVNRALQRRTCDCAWRVWFKDGRSVVFLIEFRSSPKNDMVLQTMSYNEAAHSLLCDGKRDPDGGLPLVLSFVVYAGERPWKAARTLAELAKRGPPAAAVARNTVGMETRHGYGLLDLRRALAQGLISRDGVLGWLAMLEEEPWANFPAVHRSMAEQWGGKEYRRAREAFAVWTVERMRAAKVPEEVRQRVAAQIDQPKEAAEMQTYQEWAEGQRLEERTAVVLRLASRRFGREAARQLEGLVGSMGAEQLIQVVDAVVDCGTAEEFLAVARNGGAGEG